MGCGCPRPVDIEKVVDFINRIGNIETGHMEACVREQEDIMSSGGDESEKRSRLAKAKVDHKVRCRIDKVYEYRHFIEMFPYLKDAACRYL